MPAPVLSAHARPKAPALLPAKSPPTTASGLSAVPYMILLLISCIFTSCVSTKYASTITNRTGK